MKDTKLGGRENTLDDRNKQKLDRQELWTESNMTENTKGKYSAKKIFLFENRRDVVKQVIT